jgi:hypothetical protein
MDVAGDLGAIRRILDQMGREAALEDVAAAVVPAVEANGRTSAGLHEAAEIGLAVRVQMKMIRHAAVAQTTSNCRLNHEPYQKEFIVLRLGEYHLAGCRDSSHGSAPHGDPQRPGISVLPRKSHLQHPPEYPAPPTSSRQ